jgi:hypothetical protein
MAVDRHTNPPIYFQVDLLLDAQNLQKHVRNNKANRDTQVTHSLFFESQWLILLNSGSFHADEALAVYLLRLTPAFKQAPVTRSRNSEVLQQCDIIVDVEGKYDGTKHFDHHQRGFDHVFSEKFHTKLSSAGLIYKLAP